MSMQIQEPSRERGVARSVRRILPLVLLLWAGMASRAEAVSVSPAALYLDARSRAGTLLLTNTGTLPEEVEVSFAFGYPQSDARGHLQVPLMHSAPEGEPSATEWLRAFPRRVVLQPGQSQVVRILAQPPAGLADGEYWARVMVAARGGQPPVEQVQGNVRVMVDVETVIVAALSYRQGPVSTGLEATGTAQYQDGGVELLLDLSRQGNAAYLGRLHAELLSPDGKVVGQVTEDLAVYRELRRVLHIPLEPKGEPGAYSVRYTIETERPDLPSGGALQAPRVTGTLPVSVSGPPAATG